MTKGFRKFIFNLILIYIIGGILTYGLLAFTEKLPPEAAFYSAIAWPMLLFYFVMDKLSS